MGLSKSLVSMIVKRFVVRIRFDNVTVGGSAEIRAILGHLIGIDTQAIVLIGTDIS